MVVSAVVDQLEAAGRRLIDRLVSDGIGIHAAGWVRTDYDGKPYLYIATSVVADGDTLPAYTKVQTALSVLPRSPLGLADVKAISPDDPLAVGMAEADAWCGPHPTGTTVFVDMLGSVGIHQPAFVYTIQKPVAA